MQKYNIQKLLVLLTFAVVAWACAEKEEVFPRTRLFSPVVSEDLTSIDNTIIVNLGKSKEAISYTLEVSLDTFRTIEYELEVDTNYVIINGELTGEPLLWDTRYQLRATAHADDPTFDSKTSDLGGVRTQKFPSNLFAPDVLGNDVTDVAVKIFWTRSGAPITQVKVFAASDLRLENPLATLTVESEEELEGSKIVGGLTPETPYQVAIYDNTHLRGWNNYTTKAFKVVKSSPTVIDLSESTDATAVEAAYAGANSGDTIILKKGVTYDFPTTLANKAITFMGDHGFDTQKAKFFTTGNWNVEEGSIIDHIRFIDMELQGEDIGGDYVINPSGFVTETRIVELTFEDCIINNFRGIARIRNTMFIDNYNIRNSIVHHIGGYGLITCDTDGDGQAAVGNITYENSTFSKVNIGIQTRQNTNAVVFESCTFSEFPEGGSRIFRYRGPDGFDEATGGVTISNCIFGHGWDQAGGENYTISAIQGLAESTFSVVNVYATADFLVNAGTEIAGITTGSYSGSTADLWVDIDNLNFNFKDSGFAGRFDSGDPRWRAQ